MSQHKLDFEFFAETKGAVRYHQKGFTGKGTPDGYAIGMIYLRKAWLAKENHEIPTNITVTVDIPDAAS